MRRALAIALLLLAGCGRPDDARCKEACIHLADVLGHRVRRCEESCRAHGSPARVDCLVAAATPAEVQACHAE